MSEDKKSKSEMTQLFNQVRGNCADTKSILMDMYLNGGNPADAVRIDKSMNCSAVKPAAGATLEGERAKGEVLKAAKARLKAIDNRRAY